MPARGPVSVPWMAASGAGAAARGARARRRPGAAMPLKTPRAPAVPIPAAAPLSDPVRTICQRTIVRVRALRRRPVGVAAPGVTLRPVLQPSAAGPQASIGLAASRLPLRSVAAKAMGVRTPPRRRARTGSTVRTAVPHTSLALPGLGTPAQRPGSVNVSARIVRGLSPSPAPTGCDARPLRGRTSPVVERKNARNQDAEPLGAPASGRGSGSASAAERTAIATNLKPAAGVVATPRRF